MKQVSNQWMSLIVTAAALAAVMPSAAMAANEGPDVRERRESPALAVAPTPRHRAPAESDNELEEIAAFMRQYAPARWAAMDALPEAGAVRRGVMVYVVARWRHLQILREEDAALYEIKVRQMAVEDAIYGMLARTRSPAEREPLRKNLREKVDELVKLGLTERTHRIERLRQALTAEENRLKVDQKAMKSMVDRRVDAFIMEGPVTLHPDLPRRPSHAPKGPIPGADEKSERPLDK